VSGERVIRKTLLADSLRQLGALPRFGVEVFMNRRIIAGRYRVAVARWGRVTQTRKTEKLGYWKGTCAEWRMIADLLRVAKPPELIAQNWHLLGLRVASGDGGGRLAHWRRRAAAARLWFGPRR